MHASNTSADILPSPPRVVLVDDDDALLAALKFRLELDGFAVTTHAGSTSVDVEKLRFPRGCLVLDHLMPGETGLDLLARLRAAAVSLPAIVITSYANPAILRRAAGLGAIVVEKPLLRDELINAILQAMAGA